MNRRGFLTGLVAAVAAPAIVRPGLIMPIKPALLLPNERWLAYYDLPRDRFYLRADFSQRPLPVPSGVAVMARNSMAVKRLIRQFPRLRHAQLLAMEQHNGQFSCDVVIPGAENAEIAIARFLGSLA